MKPHYLDEVLLFLTVTEENKVLIIWKEHKPLNSCQYFCTSEGIRYWKNVCVRSVFNVITFFFSPQFHTQTHFSPWYSPAKHPRYQRNRLAKGICCDKLIKVSSETKAWLFWLKSENLLCYHLSSHRFILGDVNATEKLRQS